MIEPVLPEPPPSMRSSGGWTRARVVFLAISATLVLLLLLLVRDVLLPFILAITLAYVLAPLVAWCEYRTPGKFRGKRALSILLVYGVTIAILYFSLAAILPRVYVEAAKFAPLGRRGLFTSRQGYGVPDYLEVANDHTLLIALIEDIRAVENLDAILAVDHIDVFFVAPSDLAASMGMIGRNNDPKVQRTIDETLKRIVAAGRNAGTLLVNNEGAERFMGMGVRFLASYMLPWLTRGLRDVRQQVGGG